VGLDLQRSGGLLVVGPPGSGRSAALRAFARHCSRAGAAVVDLVHDAAPAHAAAGKPQPERHGEPDQLGRGDAEGLRAWLSGPARRRAVVVIADDLATLPEAVGDLLVSSVPPGGRPIVIGAGTAADLTGSFRGPAVALRRSRTILFLQPAAGDAELLGLRTPRTPLPPRPGAGWLVTPTLVTRLQVARRRVLRTPP
jgi:S-DNA-T family DNA segregation ATPase FtsK/SpoIIIE